LSTLKREDFLNLSSIEKWIFFFFLLFPLIINPYGSDVHELPKALFLKITIIFLSFFFFYSLESLKIRISSLTLPLAFFILLLTFTSFFSPNLSESFLGESLRRFGVFYFWWCFLLFLLLFVLSERGREMGKIALLFSGFLVSLYAILQSLGFDFLPPSKNWEVGRAFATFGNPLYMAGFIILVIPLFWDFWEKYPSYRLFSAFGIVFSSAALILSYSRAAILVLFLVSLLYFVLKRGKPLEEKAGVLIVLGGLVLAFILLQASGLKPVERFTSPISFEKGAVPRLSFWKLALNGIAERPLTGYGWGSFLNYFRRNSKILVKEEGLNEVADKVHNDYLEFGFSGGIFSLLFFLWLSLYFFIRKSEGGEKNLPLKIGVLAYLLFVFTTFSTVSTFPIFLSFLALAEKGEWEFKINPNRNIWKVVVLVLLIFFTYFLFSDSRAVVADTFKGKGIEALEGGNWRESIPLFERVVYFEPGDKWNWLYLGRSYFAGGRNQRKEDLLESAANSYKKAIELDPYFFEAHLDLGSVYLFWGEAFQKKDLVEKAKNNFKSAVYIFPASSVGYYQLGLSYIALGDTERAIKSWEISAKNNPSFPDPLFSLGVAYESRGEFEKAEEYFLKAQKIAGDKEALDLIRESLENLKKKR
jgi:tetratricopeptide (TPR) repeat protein